MTPAELRLAHGRPRIVAIKVKRGRAVLDVDRGGGHRDKLEVDSAQGIELVEFPLADRRRVAEALDRQRLARGGDDAPT